MIVVSDTTPHCAGLENEVDINSRDTNFRLSEVATEKVMFSASRANCHEYGAGGLT
jgi:hypothetical protein